MKQAERVAHSSGRSGGDSLVLEYPGAGVLQKIPMATGCIPLPDAVMQLTMDRGASSVTSQSLKPAAHQRHGAVTP